MFNLLRCKKRKKLVDNYYKVCHILDLTYNPDTGGYIGKCSLCGAKNAITNYYRCMNCRAKIEED